EQPGPFEQSPYKDSGPGSGCESANPPSARGGDHRLHGTGWRRFTIPAMTELTRILRQIQEGDALPAEQLLPLVYDELRQLATQRLAKEKPGQTLQPTALVHEAYPRLVGADPKQPWDSRGHFFTAVAEAMRRILVEKARRKRRIRHGGGVRRV